MKNLDIILKVAEVCNINCTYCYFFNGPDQSFRSHPNFMSTALAAKVMAYVGRALEQGEISAARIILHGGEPLMLGKRRFQSLCDEFCLSHNESIDLVIQTNAMLVDPEWIEIFSRYRISVGVSVDGPALYHDEFRIDHKGRGTHARTALGIKLLTDSAETGSIPPIAALCVVDPTRDPRMIYRHIVDDLRINAIDFLLPDGDWNTISTTMVTNIGAYLLQALEAWIADDDPNVQIRIFNDIVRFALFKKPSPSPARIDGYVVGVSSDGSLGPDDAFRTTLPSLFTSDCTTLNVQDSTLSDYVQTYHEGHLGELKNLPRACASCRWSPHCGGGDGAHRFSEDFGFGRQSVYCEALKPIYERLEAYMSENGVVKSHLDSLFCAPASASAAC